jgi:hypothetical protein
VDRRPAGDGGPHPDDPRGRRADRDPDPDDFPRRRDADPEPRARRPARPAGLDLFA